MTDQPDPKTRMAPRPRRIDDPPAATVMRWLVCGWLDFRSHPVQAISYGTMLALLGWGGIALLWHWGLSWMILPALAGAMLVGPAATVGIYRISRLAMGRGGGLASPGQVALAGAILMVLMLTWLRAATLIFAVFFGLVPFSGFTETLLSLLQSPQGIATVVTGTLIGGLFAAFTFAISAFSIPMLVDHELDCFSAMALSFSATIHNFKLAVTWGATVSGAILIGVCTGFVGLIFLFPLLGFATWHAYCDLFHGETQHDDHAS